VKTLSDIKTDMSQLYEEVKSGATELNKAAELANIAGKFLKAEQLQLAREIFTQGRTRVQLLPAEGESPRLSD
jgi:hypothetical protein